MFKIATLAAFFLFVAGTFGASRTTFFNTGVDRYGAPLRNDQVDVHYTLAFTDPFQYKDPTQPLDGQTAAVVPAGGWLGWHGEKGGLSRWISIPKAEPPANAAPGFYQFRTAFTLSNFNPSTFCLKGRWATDNDGVGIYLNGHLVSFQNAPGFVDWTPLTIGPSSYFDTNNTLDFVVQNAGNLPSPMGLRVELAESVSEPTSLWLVGAVAALLVGAVAALLFVLRRRVRARRAAA